MAQARGIYRSWKGGVFLNHPVLQELLCQTSPRQGCIPQSAANYSASRMAGITVTSVTNVTIFCQTCYYLLSLLSLSSVTPPLLLLLSLPCMTTVITAIYVISILATWQVGLPSPVYHSSILAWPVKHQRVMVAKVIFAVHKGLHVVRLVC